MPRTLCETAEPSWREAAKAAKVVVVQKVSLTCVADGASGVH